MIDIQGRRAFSELTEERKTVPEGAAKIVWCAVRNQLDGKGGVYCQNIDIAPLVPIDGGKPGLPGVCPWAADEQAAKRLWSLSEELTGVSFTI
ncbi:hypothetical protein [Brevibacillus brevis]|uniref:hypothetical protein n=1 Tax=Brevibacillus brevis TaxID=1393 RepID=UPI00277D0E76|nr:hypothetical protein [Brevibacillus brevis]